MQHFARSNPVHLRYLCASGRGRFSPEREPLVSPYPICGGQPLQRPRVSIKGSAFAAGATKMALQHSPRMSEAMHMTTGSRREEVTVMHLCHLLAAGFQPDLSEFGRQLPNGSGMPLVDRLKWQLWEISWAQLTTAMRAHCRSSALTGAIGSFR